MFFKTTLRGTVIMIRFIDLTGQIYLDEDEESPIKVFAFFDTVTDKFLSFSGFEKWESIERFLNLIPKDYFIQSKNVI